MSKLKPRMNLWSKSKRRRKNPSMSMNTRKKKKKTNLVEKFFVKA